jgi:hypothetical protein
LLQWGDLALNGKELKKQRRKMALAGPILQEGFGQNGKAATGKGKQSFNASLSENYNAYG